MLAIKRSISFSVEKPKATKADSKKKSEQPTGRLRCTVTWNRQRVRISVNHSVNPNNWEPSVQRCKAKTYHGKYKTPASVVNHDIEELENLLERIFIDFEIKNVIPTKEQVLRAYAIAMGKEEKPLHDEIPIADRPLFSIYDEFARDGEISGRWSEGTQEKKNTIRNHLEKMSPTLSLNDVIRGGVNALIQHFGESLDNSKEIGMSNVTIKRDIAFIKTFMRWAQEHGYCDASTFLAQKVKLKTAEKLVIFLDWDELMLVYNWDFGTKNYLAQVRDVFCFCCFTSLRYSDVYNLRRSNIVGNEIKLTTIKTSDSLIIELNKYSKAILDKYADFQFKGDKALPVISNQRMNDYLKEIGEICKLETPITLTTFKGAKRIDKTYKKWELLSTHCGRRTFVCNAIKLGIHPNVVMKWTGHSDFKTFKKYLAIADTTKATAMKAFDNTEDYPGSENGGAKVGQKAGQKFDFD